MSFESWRSYWIFRDFVKNKSRYHFDKKSNDFLKAIEDTCEERLLTIPVSQSLWRAQVGCEYLPLTQENIHINDLPVPFEFKRMIPLKNSASEGRANPKGIPYLYVATDKETAMSEVRPSLGTILSVGEFTPSRELKIIDFSVHQENNKMALYLKEPCEEKRVEAVWADMDKAFSVPISNTNFTSDYVPTQIIAEFIKSLDYDGIAYKSSLGRGKNIALFGLESASIKSCNIFNVSCVDYAFIEEQNQFTQTY
jgi:hypothetical protein